MNINQKRGLRQRDPLSPYFFVICMEYLSSLILEKVECGKWEGIKASPNGPVIYHLFFVDDLMLFAKVDRSNCATMLDVLGEFCCKSGQAINFTKSKIFFSSNTTRRERLTISFQSGLCMTENLSMYLGIPLIHGRRSANTYNYIVERMRKKLSG